MTFFITAQSGIVQSLDYAACIIFEHFQLLFVNKINSTCSCKIVKLRQSKQLTCWQNDRINGYETQSIAVQHNPLYLSV